VVDGIIGTNAHSDYFNAEKIFLQFNDGSIGTISQVEYPHRQLGGELDFEIGISNSVELSEFNEISGLRGIDLVVNEKITKIKLYSIADNILQRWMNGGRPTQLEFFFANGQFISIGYYSLNRESGVWDYLYSGELCLNLNSSLEEPNLKLGENKGFITECFN
jgi:hypothetical protein